MAPENHFPDPAPPLNLGQPISYPAAGQDWSWIVRWVLVTTAAIPAAVILASPFAAIGLWLGNLLGVTGLWQGNSRAILTMIGAAAGLGLSYAVAQWLMLRHWLPRARVWLTATSAGLLLGESVYGIGLMIISTLNGDFAWVRSLLLPLAGIILGLLQWLYLRKILPNAFWIILIDALAVGSILINGDSITSLPELFLILFLPGTITGVGLWLLLRQPHPGPAQTPKQPIPGVIRRLPRFVQLGLGLAALLPVFFICSWAFVASQLALAKNEGIYPTPEEAVLGTHSQGWGGANVVKIEGVRVSPNNHSGALPHVWFGEATIYLDRVPEGFNRTYYSAGSFYIHVRDGWVHLPEGAFPGFVGWVMQLYNMENVREWIQGT